MEKIALDHYTIVIDDISTSLTRFLSDRKYSSIVVLVDEHVATHCLPKISDIVADAHVMTITSGEEHKVIDSCIQIWSEMGQARTDRHALMINLGGGVIGDMGGFAASCYMRGIDFIQIPTTLLSQVDASVGGKLAIDFHSYKNFIGLFCDPKAVLIDPHFLETLPKEQLRSGFAEVIKHGLIASRPLWERIRSYEDLEAVDWTMEIGDSVRIKKDVVQKDPKENGLRKILNFGHTIGHALESYALSSDHPLLHGEAIALGMIAESFLSTKLSTLSEASLEDICSYIQSVYGDVHLASLEDSERIFDLMRSDKKNKGGEVRAAFLEDIGKAIYDVPLIQEDVAHALAFTKVKMTSS